MTQEERLEFCEKCKFRKSDEQGQFVCSLSNKAADFEVYCPHFLLDETIPLTDPEKTKFAAFDTQPELSQHSYEKLLSHQDFNFAIAGGLIAAIVSGCVWAFITVLTEMQIGFMAIGVGFLVGFTIRYFGAGIESKFNYLGGVLSLIGCLIGNLFSQVGFIANAQSLGYLETMSFLNLSLIVEIFKESFSGMDLFFYAIAIYEGYRFSTRKLLPDTIIDLNSNTYDGEPSNKQYRLPIVVLGCIAILFLGYQIKVGNDGFKSYKYDSGKKMSEGEIKNNLKEGVWTNWFENGNKEFTGNYINDMPENKWQWFYESGKLQREGVYKRGFEDGVWINYYENGVKIDSGRYENGRMQGFWRYYHENGNLYQTCFYKNNLQDSITTTYFENGQINSISRMKDGEFMGLQTNYYSNGQIFNELNYLQGNIVEILNAWMKNGKQLVINGAGVYKEFDENGKVLVMGNVRNKMKVDTWKFYYPNGRLKEEGSFENNSYKLVNAWNIGGDQFIRNGEGNYNSYYDDSNNVFETGTISAGKRNGNWKMFHPDSKEVLQEMEYLNGQMNGELKTYYESGQIFQVSRMVNDLRDGISTWYYEDGTEECNVRFKNNKKEGKQTFYSNSGKKIKEEIYKNGILIETVDF